MLMFFASVEESLTSKMFFYLHWIQDIRQTATGVYFAIILPTILGMGYTSNLITKIIR